MPELLATPGLIVVALPPELHNMTVFAAGLGMPAREPAGARALVEFLRTPGAARVIKARGMEPG